MITEEFCNSIQCQYLNTNKSPLFRNFGPWCEKNRYYIWNNKLCKDKDAGEIELLNDCPYLLESLMESQENEL